MSATSGAEGAHAVGLVFRLLARLFPYRRTPGRETVTLAELQAQFKGWNWAVVGMTFAFAPFMIVGSKLALNRLFPPPPAPAGSLLHITVDPMFFAVPGIFLGLILTALPVMLVTAVLLGGRFSDFLLMGNLQVGFDSTKIWTALAAILAALSLFGAALAAPVHLTVFPDSLEIRHLARATPQRIPNANIRSASLNSAGTLVLHFADGTQWGFADDASLLCPTPDQVRFLAARYPASGPR